MEDTDVRVQWRRSDFCTNQACVEVARTESDTFLVRDSKHPDGLVLTFDRGEWDAFVSGMKAGNFDFR